MKELLVGERVHIAELVETLLGAMDHHAETMEMINLS